MSKFSPALKALINAPRQDLLKASPTIRDVYSSIAQDAHQRHVSPRTWLCLSTAATVTLNSPESLLQLHSVASSSSTKDDLSPNLAADLMREVALKCISFSGIPRTILSLTALVDLPTQGKQMESRTATPENLSAITARGEALWGSIYAPPNLAARLTSRLGAAHPNLPRVIQQAHYGQLLADPSDMAGPAKVGRALTSIVAVAGLRAQGGVSLQVTSHVRGLQNAIAETESADAAQTLEVDADEVQGVRWLGSDEGAVWLLESVDKIVASLVSDEGSRFGRSKL